MSDIMFEVPSDDSIKTVIITKKCITDLKEPKIIHENKETKKQQAAALDAAAGKNK